MIVNERGEPVYELKEKGAGTTAARKGKAASGTGSKAEPAQKPGQKKAAGEKVFPHVFGTDMYGRDIMVRVMYGARVSMAVGICAALLVLVIGATYGAISGYCGGRVDAVMQRFVELIYSVPEMLVVLLIATALKPILTEYVNSGGTSPLKSFVNILGPNLISMFIAFGVLYWVTMSRIIRGQVLQALEDIYGPDNVRVAVSSVVDVNRRVIDSTTYHQPEGSVEGGGLIGKDQWYWEIVRDGETNMGGTVGTSTNSDINTYPDLEPNLNGDETAAGASGDRTHMIDSTKEQVEVLAFSVSDVQVALP